MASKYAVETTFRLIDQITPKLDTIGIKGNVVGKALKKDFMATQDAMGGLGDKLKTFGKYAAMAGIAAIGAGLAYSTKQFIDFDAALYKAGGVFSDLDSTSDGFSESLKKIGIEARAVAAATEFNAMQTADALATMAMAGIESEQAIKLLGPTADLATAAGLDLNNAAGIAADALGVFGLKVDDPIQLADNFSYLSDVMVKTASLANMDLPMMYEAVVAGGKEFSKTNQSIEEFGAAVDVLAENGYKGSEAGRAINTMMVRLASPAAAGAKALESLGIETKDSSGNLLNFTDIIGQFETAFAGKGTAEVAGYIDKIFGKNQYTKASALINAGADALKGYTEQLRNSGGATAQMAETMRKSLANRIEVMKSALTELGFKIVETFAEKGGSIVEKFTKAVDSFDPAPIISALSTAANIIMTLGGILWKMRDFIMGAAIAWGIYKVAMIGAVIVSNIMGMVKAVKTLMAAQKGMNVVQAIFNVLLTSNPIGLICVGVGILIGLVLLMVRHWDDICAVMGRAWEWINNVAAIIRDGLVSAFQAVAQWIQTNSEKALALITIFTGPFGFIISIIKELKDNWGSVVEAFESDGIIGALQRIGAIVLSAVLAPIQGFLEILAKIPGVDKLLGPAIDKIKTFREELTGTEVAVSADGVVPSAVNNESAATRTATSGAYPVSAGISPATAQPTTPITQAEQSAYYSRTESREQVDISVRPEPGAAATMKRRGAPSSRVNIIASGDN